MQIREATYSDIDRIMDLFAQAREYMRVNGIPQWQDGYPDYDTVFGDIDDGICYVVVDGGVTVSTFVCDFSGEPSYNVIFNGEWIVDGEYAALHRIAVDNGCKGKGVGGFIIDFIRNRCIENGVDSVRGDTHELNCPMRRMLEKNGFRYCGVIRLANGEARVAYQLEVKQQV